jgi:beta-mannosidase
MKKKKLLIDNWILNLDDEGLNHKFIKSSKIKKIPATIPGTIHTDLLNAKLIPGPFYADNESSLKWISELDWLYETSFDFPEDFADNVPILICFEGLDTVSEIMINGQEVGQTNNMFRKYEFDISQFLKLKNNLLQVNFKSPLRVSGEMQEKYGKIFSVRNHQRVYLRKAQYSFGWDWGPAFPTMGIWKPVYLLQPASTMIKSVLFDTTDILDDEAYVRVRVELDGKIESNYSIAIEMKNENKHIEKDIPVHKSNLIVSNIIIKNPDLWWPNGYGKQNLYDLQISLQDREKKLIDTWHKKVGIRKVQLVTSENDKSVFRFYINNKPVYIKGANWIPSDSFIPRITESKYQKLLIFSQKSNMNMLRVWGGGIYENDIFYQLCDELGLLVWQDFMFACSAYPELPEFFDNIREEVKENVKRIQHHPSVAIWCGNNENEWIWYRENMGSLDKMPGYKIYHQLIPEILKGLDPERPYWPTSPFGNSEDPNNSDSGNQHSWDIWSRWVDYEEVINDNSLFVTEFGFQAPANRKTLEDVLPIEQRKTQNEMFDFHNKQIEGTERLFRFLSGHLPVKTEWKDFIYLTQLNQAFALKICLEHWRFNSPVTNGSIIWQLNDCWPVTSWSLIDSELLPKISYYFVKNVYSPVSMKIEKENMSLKILLSNQSQVKFCGNIQIDTIEIISGDVINKEKETITIDPDSIITFSKKLSLDSRYIVVATLLNEDKTIANRNYFSEKKWKYLELNESEITIKSTKDESENYLTISVDKPSYFVDFHHPKLNFSDRGFIILPNEEHKVKVIGGDFNNSDLNKIEIFSLNKYLCK